MSSTTYELLGYIMSSPRLDEWSDLEIERRIDADYQEVFMRACKVIPALIEQQFKQWQGDPFYPDMLSAGFLGVQHAIETWDRRKGASLSTWAHICARQHMSKAVQKELAYRERNELVEFAVSSQDSPRAWDVADDDGGQDKAGWHEREMQWIAEYSIMRHRLSTEEQAVLDGLRDGYSYREIAHILGVSHVQVVRLVARMKDYVAKIQQNKIVPV